MKKMVIGILTLFACISQTKERVTWRHNGIYIVNKTEGSLKIMWDDQTRELAATQKILIPITAPGVEIKIEYSDTVPAYADMPTCRGGAHTSLKTGKRIVLYEIHGGHDDGKGAFNQPGRGPHCTIHAHHQGFTPETAIQRYPELK